MPDASCPLGIAQSPAISVRMQTLNLQSLKPIVWMHTPSPPSYEDVVQMSKSASSLPPAYNVATQTDWTGGGQHTNITGQEIDGEMFLNETRNSYHFLKFVMIILMLFMLLFVLAWTSLALDGCLFKQ